MKFLRFSYKIHGAISHQAPSDLAGTVESWYNQGAALLQSGNREEVSMMTGIVISFLVSLAAGIACHYICAWLDSRGKGG